MAVQISNTGNGRFGFSFSQNSQNFKLSGVRRDFIEYALTTRAGIDWRPWQLSTLFTDTAGTVPATAPGDIIAVQKSPSKAGLQFQQTTLANRPVLVRHPKRGRVNELVGTATMSTQNVTTTAAQRTLSFTGTGTVTLSGTSTAGPLVGTGVSDRVSLTFTPTAGTLTLTVSGSVTDAQLQLGAAFDSLQTVNATGTSITEPGQSECWGLQHDGINDNMVTTGTLNLSGSGQFAAVIGMTKSSDAARQIVLEQSSGLQINAPPGAAYAGYSMVSQGTVLATALTPTIYPAPSINVVTAIGDIAGDKAIIRVNGSLSAQSLTDQGTGTQKNAAMDKFSRGTSSLFVNGIDWGGAVISGLDATTDAALIAAIERQIAQNTPGVTIP